MLIVLDSTFLAVVITTPIVYLSYSVPLLYHFHTISCFPFSPSSKLNYMCISPAELPVFHPVSHTKVTPQILLPSQTPFISFHVCLWCWRHPESFSHRFILLPSNLYSDLTLLFFFAFCLCCWVSFVCYIVFIATSKATWNAVWCTALPSIHATFHPLSFHNWSLKRRGIWCSLWMVSVCIRLAVLHSAALHMVLYLLSIRSALQHFSH